MVVMSCEVMRIIKVSMGRACARFARSPTRLLAELAPRLSHGEPLESVEVAMPYLAAAAHMPRMCLWHA
jgi:hypothetical protein